MRPAILLACAMLVPMGQVPMGSASSDAWIATLTLRIGVMEDAAEVGFTGGASPSFDAWVDRPEPPSPPGASWVRLYVSGDDPRPELRLLDRSLTAPSDLFTWSLRPEAGPDVLAAELHWTSVAVASHAVELVVGDEIFDLRSSGSVELDFTDGPVEAHVDAYVLDGSAPSPPRHLLALPGEARGEIELRWTPPADDGGLPLRGYHLYEETLDGRRRLATVGLTTTYVDRGREIGEVVVYTAEAFNALAPSGPSLPAIGVGTARERTLQPTSAASDWRPLLTARASSDPAMQALPFFHIGGSPNASDPRVFDVAIRVLGEERSVGLFHAGLLSPFEIGSADVAEIGDVAVEAALLRSDAERELIVRLEVEGPEDLRETFAAGG